MAVYEYFPPELIMLMDELCNHPECMEAISKTDPEEGWESRLAVVATYCGYEIDGYFTDAELAEICKRLTARLYEKRTLIVLPH